MAKKKKSKKKSSKKKKSKKSVVDEGKTIAIVSYITLVGVLIAYLMNKEENNKFASFHIRQSLLLNLIAIGSSFIGWIPFIGQLILLALFILWLIGLIGAINGEKKEVPVLGSYAQEWFKGL